MFWNSTGYLDCICCLTRIRTLTGRSRNYSATITPWDNTFLPLFNVWKAHSDCLPVLLPALWCKITKIILYNNAFSKNKNRLNFIFEIQPITIDWLSHQDSNLVRQNQKLQCYHYTMRQSLGFISKAVQRYILFSFCQNLLENYSQIVRFSLFCGEQIVVFFAFLNQ